jgi:FtsP/CotA-like multicopper oxidase with cupredoxin domain
MVALGALVVAVTACGPGDSDNPINGTPAATPTGETVQELDHSGHQGHGSSTVAARQLPDQGEGGQPLPSRVEDGVRIFELTAEAVQWEVAPGVVKEAWTYNGTVPGPLLRMTEGEKVRVILHNELATPVTIHWHGLRVPNDMDGVPTAEHPAVQQGGTFPYEFTATPAGTHWYHTHFDSTVAVAKGLYGPLIVDPKVPGTAESADRDITLMLGDGPLGFNINGKDYLASQPIRVKQGELVRMRFINNGSMNHPMHLHGLTYDVVAKDGYPLTVPYQADTIDVAPGETYDVLVRADNPGT